MPLQTTMKRAVDDGSLWLVRALIFLTVCFLLVPIVFTTVLSFDARSFLGPFPPKEFSLRWYESFFSDNYYLQGLKNSLFLAVVSTLVSTTIGVLAAFAIDRYEFRGKSALSSFFLSPLLVPPVVTGFGLLMFLSSIGIFDGFVRLLCGHLLITGPYVIRTTLASLVGINRNLTEAAMSLGATERQSLSEITLPLARTGIAAGAVFAFAISMDDVAVSIFLTDPDTTTLPVALVSKMRANFDLTVAAASVILMAITITMIFLLDRAVGLERIVGQGIYRG